MKRRVAPERLPFRARQLATPVNQSITDRREVERMAGVLRSTL